MPNVELGVIFKGIDQLGGTLRSVRANVQGSAVELHALGQIADQTTSAIYGVFNSAITQSANFDSSMRKLSTIFGESDMKATKMSDTVRDMAKQMGESPEGLAEALYGIGSAGQNAENGLKVLEVAAKGAIGGFTDTQTAADGITSALNAWKMEASEAGHVMDVFVQAQNKGKMVVGDIARGMGQTATIASALGVSLEEVASMAASLTSTGKPAAEAFTNVRAALQAAGEPAADMAKKAANMGVAFDASKYAALGTIDKLKYLADITDGDVGKMQNLVGSVEAVQAVLAITGSGAQVYADNLAAMGDSSGKADEAFSKMADSTSRKFAIMKQTVMDLAITVGDVAVPIITSLVSVSKPLIDVFSAIAKSAPGEVLLTIATAAGLAALGVSWLTSMYIKASSAWTAASRAYNTISKAIQGVRAAHAAQAASAVAAGEAEAAAASAATVAKTGSAAATGAMGTSMLAALGPIALVVAALTGLAFEIGAVVKAYGEMRKAQNEAWESAENLARKEDEIARAGGETARQTAVRLFGEEGGKRYDKGELTDEQNKALRAEQLRLREKNKRAAQVLKKINEERDRQAEFEAPQSMGKQASSAALAAKAAGASPGDKMTADTIAQWAAAADTNAAALVAAGVNGTEGAGIAPAADTNAAALVAAGVNGTEGAGIAPAAAASAGPVGSVGMPQRIDIHFSGDPNLVRYLMGTPEAKQALIQALQSIGKSASAVPIGG